MLSVVRSVPQGSAPGPMAEPGSQDAAKEEEDAPSPRSLHLPELDLDGDLSAHRGSALTDAVGSS